MVAYDKSDDCIFVNSNKNTSFQKKILRELYYKKKMDDPTLSSSSTPPSHL